MNKSLTPGQHGLEEVNGGAVTWLYSSIQGIRVRGASKNAAENLLDRFAGLPSISRRRFAKAQQPHQSHFGPSSADWHGNWSVDDLMEAQWSLSGRFSGSLMERLLSIFEENPLPASVTVSLECHWPHSGHVAIQSPLTSFFDQDHQDGIWTTVSPQLSRYAASKKRKHQDAARLYGELADAWGVADALCSKNNSVVFEPERLQLPEGKFFAANRKDGVAFVTTSHIEKVDIAKARFLSGLQSVREFLGDPFLVRLSYSAFNNATAQCASLCETLSDTWYQSVFGDLTVDPFWHPGYAAVFPYHWHSRETREVVGDEFLDFQISVEHTDSGETNMLLHTNHPVDWLKEEVEAAGLGSQMSELDQSEIYPGLNLLK